MIMEGPRVIKQMWSGEKQVWLRGDEMCSGIKTMWSGDQISLIKR